MKQYKDVDGHDDEREGLEPVLCADTPFVLDHHEADTAGESRIELGIVEPAVHVNVGLVLKSPACATAYADCYGHKVDGEGQRNDKERDDAAEFGTTGEFIEEDKAQQDHDEHTPLCEGVRSPNLEK